MKVGKDSVVMGNVSPDANIGERSVVVGATDSHGNTILNKPMAVGYGAKAGPGSIAIGAQSLAAPTTPSRPWWLRLAENIIARTIAGLLVVAVLIYLGLRQ